MEKKQCLIGLRKTVTNLILQTADSNDPIANYLLDNYPEANRNASFLAILCDINQKLKDNSCNYPLISEIEKATQTSFLVHVNTDFITGVIKKLHMEVIPEQSNFLTKILTLIERFPPGHIVKCASDLAKLSQRYLGRDGPIDKLTVIRGIFAEGIALLEGGKNSTRQEFSTNRLSQPLTISTAVNPK